MTVITRKQLNRKMTLYQYLSVFNAILTLSLVVVICSRVLDFRHLLHD